MEIYQIAIDGPAASGKSTIAKRIAQRLGGFYISTGEMFRALGWQVLCHHIDPKSHPEQVVAMLPAFDLKYRDKENHTLELTLNQQPVPNEEIRRPEVAQMASAIATISEVRTFMKKCQQQTADLGIVVMEGRDIGTVIFPQAKFKFFITASPLIRAQRRFAQGEIPEGATIESVVKEIAFRDEQDSNRAIAPLRAAEDAIQIITDDYSIEEVVELVIGHIKKSV